MTTTPPLPNERSRSEYDTGRYPRCEKCGCKWHGLPCLSMNHVCESSWEPPEED